MLLLWLICTLCLLAFCELLPVPVWQAFTEVSELVPWQKLGKGKMGVPAPLLVLQEKLTATADILHLEETLSKLFSFRTVTFFMAGANVMPQRNSFHKFKSHQRIFPCLRINSKHCQGDNLWYPRCKVDSLPLEQKCQHNRIRSLQCIIICFFLDHTASYHIWNEFCMIRNELNSSQLRMPAIING